MKHKTCQTFFCEKMHVWMTDTESSQHLTEHPDHKLYDVRSDLARQYGCASIEEFVLLNQSLVASGVSEIPEPPAEYFE